MKLKFPSFLKPPRFKPKRARAVTLRASAARASQPARDYNEEEPTTSLSSAFVVVLLLHVVAVGGIYAFNSIKAHRHVEETAAASPAEKPAPKAAEPAEATPEIAPVNLAKASAAPAAAPATGRVYHVRAGDTMAKVAGAHGISAFQLADANNMKETAPLRVGQTLTIPTPKAASATQRKQDFLALQATTPRGAAGAKTYTVAKGDNPVAIARKLHISSEQLMKLNGIENPSKLQIGQVLKVPVKGGTPAASTP